MNRIYPAALDEIGRANLDLETVNLSFMLVDASYVYDDTDSTLADVAAGARISAATPVAGTLAMSGGVLSSDVEATNLPAVPVNVDDVAAVVMFDDTGTPSTSRLVAYWANQADTTLVDVTTDGGDVTITFAAGRLMRI